MCIYNVFSKKCNLIKHLTLNYTKATTMKSDKYKEMVHWLNQQINHINDSIKEAHNMNNVGRETQLEGMRDAFIRCLNMLNKAL